MVAAIAARGSATGSARVHGGGGHVSRDGVVGKLHLDRSTAVDVHHMTAEEQLGERIGAAVPVQLGDRACTHDGFFLFR